MAGGGVGGMGGAPRCGVVVDGELVARPTISEKNRCLARRSSLDKERQAAQIPQFEMGLEDILGTVLSRCGKRQREG